MLTTTLENISLADAGISALLGYAVVFFGLILLMLVVTMFGKFFAGTAKKEKAASIPEKAENVSQPTTAPGSAGCLKLYNTDPKTAAMLMAIVADKLQKPINELRFLSIKEVEK